MPILFNIILFLNASQVRLGKKHFSLCEPGEYCAVIELELLRNTRNVHFIHYFQINSISFWFCLDLGLFLCAARHIIDTIELLRIVYYGKAQLIIIHRHLNAYKATIYNVIIYQSSWKMFLDRGNSSVHVIHCIYNADTLK